MFFYLMFQEILITIGVTLLVIILIAGVIFLMFLEQRRYRDEMMLVTEEIIPFSTLRKMIERTIKRNRKKNKPFTLILVDIDNFQEVRDAFNSEEEKFIMQYITEHIKAALPEESVMSPGLHSDQFYIYIPSSFDHSHILTLAQSIKREAEKKVEVFEKIVIKKTVSLAIATYPLHGSTEELLLQALDIAMYVVKKNGGNGIKYYTDELATDKDLLNLYQELQAAVHREEFIYHYQPIVATDNEKTLYGVEALLRWNHPKRGLLTPPQFLHLAETSGELDHIGIWGVEQALILITTLQQERLVNDLIVNINVSPRQILNEDTFLIFQRMIEKYRTKPEFVAIEIPEFSTYKNNDQFMRNLIRIKTLGFKMAIDISTTDYDVIELVDKFQIDMIKLNRNFFMLEDNYNTRKYLQMITEFVHEKKLLLVAEGVETESQFLELSKKGIGYAQGFFIAKPLDQENLREYLKNATKQIES